MDRPTFQHRHYKAIAKVLAETREATRGGRVTVSDLEERLVELFQSDNDKFDVARFRAAATNASNMHGKDKR